MMTNTEIYSDLPIPPGEYLEEVITELGMTKDELARRMSRPASKLSPIFKGKKAITPDTALQLEKVVGVPADIWIGLEAEYRLSLARQLDEMEQKRLKAEIPFAKLFCYSTLSKIGVVSKVTKGIDKVLALQKFFGVTSLANVSAIQRYSVAFRRGNTNKKRSSEAIATWLRLGELGAYKIDCDPFSKKRLKSVLAEITKMTMQSPAEFLAPLTDLLAGVGVALVLCPHLPKTYANGATFYLGREKAVLMLSIRGKYADIFWFSLFHELGHILLHDRSTMFVEYENANPKMKKQEDEADKFAANTLISKRKWSAFIKQKIFYPNQINQFARELGVDRGIVVGRLQHERFLKPAWRNELRTKYEWSDS